MQNRAKRIHKTESGDGERNTTHKENGKTSTFDQHIDMVDGEGETEKPSTRKREDERVNVVM